MMKTLRLLAVVTVAVLSGLDTGAVAGTFIDDVCPDNAGTTFFVDTVAEAAAVANGYNLPSCHLVIRTSLDPGAILDKALLIVARSITLEGPLDITHSLGESTLQLVASDGNIVVSQARIAVRDMITLRCSAPSTCGVTIHRNSQIQAARTVRTSARGRVTVEDARIVGGELELRGSATR